MATTVFTFLLIEDFSLVCVVSAVDALRSANRSLGRDEYAWQFVSHDGEPVKASNNIRVEVSEKFGPDIVTDYLFVCASLQHDPPYRQKLHSGLKQALRKGTILGALSVGTFILARAGLLEGCSCTVHWELIPAFQEEFPDIDCTSSLFVIDKNRLTASGGVASMELILHLISETHGEHIAREVANQFHLDRIRPADAEQRQGASQRLDNMPSQVQSAVRIMVRNTEFPLSVAEIASEVGTSTRSLERLFKHNLQSSPGRHYLSLRLQKAKELVMHTSLSTLEIALQCGFSSGSYFSRCFQREFGARPSDLRR